MPHLWNNEWPSSCTRCGAGKVMERAIVEEWVRPPPKGEDGPEVWKTSGHRDLVLLCDDHCYADMGYDEVNRQKAAVIALCEKIGWKSHGHRENTQQRPVHQVPQRAQKPSLGQAASQESGLG